MVHVTIFFLVYADALSGILELKASLVEGHYNCSKKIGKKEKKEKENKIK